MFSFLKYTSPIWYYRLYAQSKHTLYSEGFLRNAVEKGLINEDNSYLSNTAKRSDLIYQSLNSGLIDTTNHSNRNQANDEVVDTDDNYRFVRKYFGDKWIYYTYVLRILSGCNPFYETRALIRTRNVRKQTVNAPTGFYSDFNKVEITEEFKNKKVSIIIPTLNRYTYLRDVFSDLEKQTHQNFEVLVCDQSDPFDANCYEGWSLDLKVIRQEEKALWKARNTCLERAEGELILLFDDDSRVEADWISNHIKCLVYFNADISAGVTDTIVGHGLSKKESYFHYSDVFDTGNALIKREVFERVGMFDRQFEKQRMGDGEFGLRAYLGGFPSLSNPFAKRVHLKVESGGLRHFGSWDAFRPGHLLAPRPVPSVLYLSRRYFGTGSSVMLILNSLSSSVIPYKYKKNKKLKLLSPLLMLFISPLLLVQVYRSWKLSGNMIKEGPKVELLKKHNEIAAH